MLGIWRFSAVANRRNPPRLSEVNLTLLERPLFYVGGHYVSFLGLIAFAVIFSIGLFIARVLQQHRGNLSKAAKDLKIHRNTLGKKIEEFKL